MVIWPKDNITIWIVTVSLNLKMSCRLQPDFENNLSFFIKTQHSTSSSNTSRKSHMRQFIQSAEPSNKWNLISVTFNKTVLELEPEALQHIYINSNKYGLKLNILLDWNMVDISEIIPSIFFQWRPRHSCDFVSSSPFKRYHPLSATLLSHWTTTFGVRGRLKALSHSESLLLRHLKHKIYNNTHMKYSVTVELLITSTT